MAGQWNDRQVEDVLRLERATRIAVGVFVAHVVGLWLFCVVYIACKEPDDPPTAIACASGEPPTVTRTQRGLLVVCEGK